MNKRKSLAIILAAGKGTRMRSDVPKVMHEVGNLPMLGHVIKSVQQSDFDKVALVIGPEMQEVQNYANALEPSIEVFIQKEQKGTADAVLSAQSAYSNQVEDVIVLFGDSPMMYPQTISKMKQSLQNGSDIAVLGFHASDPNGYGRLIMKGEQLIGIREEIDATEAERNIDLCNSGILGVRTSFLSDLLEQLYSQPNTKEYHLTKIVEIGQNNSLTIEMLLAQAAEVQGVNTRSQLAVCEAEFQQRTRNQMMKVGVTLRSPETVYFSYDTEIERDVIIEENVIFGTNVKIKSNARIRAFSHIEGAVISSGAVIGPYARLRPGSEIGSDSRIGNFVEIKNSKIEKEVKVNHLSYVGDTAIGEKTNIGAGTITCNYDGQEKSKTEIGSNSFVGSNSSLVAPVKIGEGAYIASGSVITEDVPNKSLGIARGRQENKLDWSKESKSKK